MLWAALFIVHCSTWKGTGEFLWSFIWSIKLLHSQAMLKHPVSIQSLAQPVTTSMNWARMPVPIRSLTQWMYITFIDIWFHVTPDSRGPFLVTRLVQKHGLLTNPTACSTRPMHYTTPSPISGCKTTLERDLKTHKLLLMCLERSTTGLTLVLKIVYWALRILFTVNRCSALQENSVEMIWWRYAESKLVVHTLQNTVMKCHIIVTLW